MLDIRNRSKDRASGRRAGEVEADLFVVAPAGDGTYGSLAGPISAGWRTVTPHVLRAKHFVACTMGRTIDADIRFVEATRRRAPSDARGGIEKTVDGDAGTAVVPWRRKR